LSGDSLINIKFPHLTPSGYINFLVSNEVFYIIFGGKKDLTIKVLSEEGKEERCQIEKRGIPTGIPPPFLPNVKIILHN
jgi:hypothetical protein